MPADAPARSIVVTTAARELRRSLGPTPWVVFEELLLHSEPALDRRAVCMSVRGLAASLGVAKDTAARAVRRLRSAGLVIPMQHRAGCGTFDTGTYRIVLTTAITVVEPATARTPRTRTTTSQLSFAIGP